MSAAEESQVPSKATILIVEDERVVAADLARKLTRLHYEVVGNVASGAEALVQARRLHPRLVLMDIWLQGPLDGIAAADAIRREQEVPVVYLTAHSDPATFARAKLTEPFGYVLKPFDDRDLATQIELALCRHQADRELRQSRAQLRALAERLQCVREEERTRIARTVHDVMGQLLTGLKMDLAAIRRRMETSGGEGATQAIQARVDSALGLADELIGEVQQLSSELRPSVLDHLGLPAAVEFETRRFQDRSGIACDLALPPAELSLAPAQVTGMFRIFQEILTNVARHAQATRVRVRLSCTADGLNLEVADNGRGIRAEEVTAARSLGLLSIRERAAALGGDVEIRGEPGRGTTVRVNFAS